MIKTHAFKTLNTSDLIIDAVYEGGSQGNMAEILISHGYASITSVKLFINNYLSK